MGLDVKSLTLYEAVKAIKKGEVSSVELVKALIEYIDEIDREINAYIFISEEDSLKMANEIDSYYSEGKLEHMELAGIPVAIKDNINVKGYPCTCGSRILKGYISPYDATAVQRLKSAGAVILGRTNMDEFAMGSSTEHSCYGVTRNPVDKERVAGGSSGGSAAAVAAGEAIAALGSDTGGSVRQPASFCGCVGLKPSYGRVSRYGLTAFASSLDQIGPITKTAKDAALLLKVIAGKDERDSTSANIKVDDYLGAFKGDGLKGLRIGVPVEYMQYGIDDDVKRAVIDAARKCEGMGAYVEEVSLPHTDYGVSAYYIIATAEASTNLARFDGVRYGYRTKDVEDILEMYMITRAEGFGPEVKRRIILGTFVLSSGYYDAYYKTALKVRRLIKQDFDNVFTHFSALITPVSPFPAFKIGEKISDPLQMYLCDMLTIPASLAGIPGISVPFARNKNGLPIGVQILARAFDEFTCLKIAGALLDEVI